MGRPPAALRPGSQRDAQLRKIGNYKFEQFEIIPLFDVFIEVVVDPKIVEDWPFSGWDGGDLGHTWRHHGVQAREALQIKALSG